MAKLNPKKMKVAELRTELEARNIEVAKGLKKADLVAMLVSALENENGPDETLLSEDGEPAELQETDGNIEDDSILLAEDEHSDEEQPVQEMETVEEQAPQENSPFNEEEPEQMDLDSNVPDQSAENGLHQAEKEEEETENLAKDADGLNSEDQAETAEQKTEPPAEPQDIIDQASDIKSVSEDVKDGTESKDIHDKAASGDAQPEPTKEIKPDPEKDETVAEESKTEERADTSERKRSSSDRRDRSESHRHDSHSSRKRHHDDHDRHHRRYEERYAPPPEEPEEEFDDTLVVLDKYNSDLNLKLHRDRLTGQPLTLEGFAYLWAGARATYGVNKSKVCYECKLSEEHSVRHLSSNEPNRHLVRMGWSRNLSSRMLGESELSYAYCGTGKKVTDKAVDDYGETFKQGDVIASYLDFSDEESITISYAKNGISLGVAFTFEKEKLGEEALFPHILSKNTTVEMNFGQKETPFYPHPEGFEDFVFLAAIPLEERIRGTMGATSRKECEVLMMCGLPGSGKTYYVENYVKEHPEKNYSVLGTQSLMNRMKASGLETKAPRSTLLNHATSCLNRLFQVACRKKRNFILDQTNVYPSAQRRRMRTFEGYQRKALVIVPNDETFKERSEKRNTEVGKDIPDYAVNEMKANFTFPEVSDLFEKVEFIELDKDEASKLIEEYRSEAKKKGPPPEKRFRGGFDTNRPTVGRGGWGGIVGGRPPFRGGMGSNFGSGNLGRFGNQRSGGYRDGRGDNRRGGGQWNKGGQGGGNWQQNRNVSSGNRGGGTGSFQGSNRGGYGGNRTGGSGGMSRNNTGQGGAMTGGGANRMNQNRNANQANRSNYNQNRNQNRGGGQQQQQQQQQQRSGGQTQSANFNYHQAYQQQAAQFSSQTAQGSQTTTAQYQQQAYNPQAQQPDYSQQWAQYYQQQAAAQQHQQAAAAAAAAQYQNYYAYQNAAYVNQQAASQTKTSQ